MAVGFRALQGNANAHLAHGASGNAVSTAEGLTAKHHVHAERSTLANESVQEERRVLRHLVIFNEQFLELVNHQEATRHAFRTLEGAPVGEVLHVGGAIEFAATTQFIIQALQDAQTKFTITLNGHRARVR